MASQEQICCPACHMRLFDYRVIEGRCVVTIVCKRKKCRDRNKLRSFTLTPTTVQISDPETGELLRAG